jgi:hypothetical protein
VKKILAGLLCLWAANAGSAVAFAADGPPDWLQRTTFSAEVQSHQEPRFYLETVQPLWQAEDQTQTVFTHDRISLQDGRGTYAAGLGYRQLFWDQKLLGGVNTFFDYQDLHQHYRQGLGLELLSSTAELRSNFYFGLSPTRLVEETAENKIYEKAVDGYDIEVGMPVPYLPYVKVYQGYYFYDYKKFKDKQGNKTRAEVKLGKLVTLSLSTYDDNKIEDREYAAEFRISLAFYGFSLKDLKESLRPSKEALPQKDLKKRMLERVERNFNIEVEKWMQNKTNGLLVEVRRDDS